MLTGRLGEGGAYFPEAAARFFDMAAWRIISDQSKRPY